MSEARTDFYFSYKGGRSRQVSKEEWEREWLEWWKRISASLEDANKD